MIRCPVCRLDLPANAQFCAQCGIRLGARLKNPAWWVLALFSIGAFLSFYSAVTMVASFYLDPALAADPSKRAAGYVIATFSTILWAIQIAALIGLARSRPWGRVVATLACAAWVLTCVGVPLSIVVLRDLWQIRRSSRRGGESSEGSG